MRRKTEKVRIRLEFVKRECFEFCSVLRVSGSISRNRHPFIAPVIVPRRIIFHFEKNPFFIELFSLSKERMNGGEVLNCKLMYSSEVLNQNLYPSRIRREENTASVSLPHERAERIINLQVLRTVLSENRTEQRRSESVREPSGRSFVNRAKLF